MVAVDKTGTLTEGRPVLTDLDVASGFERREVLAKVAAVESRSEHPIARAIVVSAEEEGIALPGMNGFESVTGMGVYATVDGTRVDVGADRYMREIGVDISGFATTAERLGQEGNRRSMRLLTVNWRRLSPWPIRSNPVRPPQLTLYISSTLRSP